MIKKILFRTAKGVAAIFLAGAVFGSGATIMAKKWGKRMSEDEMKEFDDIFNTIYKKKADEKETKAEYKPEGNEPCDCSAEENKEEK